MTLDSDGGDPRVRRAELAEGLAVVRERIAAAEAAVGRPAGDVTLVAVTKTWPATDVRLLADLGVRHVGENRDQEAAAKHAACADLGLRWHFIGQLQRNKARSVASYADVVESVDRSGLVTALDRGADSANRSLDVLIQVSIDRAWWQGGSVPPDRGGVPPRDLPRLADEVAASPRLRLAGLMAVAPLGEDPAAAFARLAVLAEEVRSRHPGATMISAGMSGDLEQAVAAGATHVRVGSAILGHRGGLR